MPLELKMRRNCGNEVFQQWELPEDEPEEEESLSLLKKLQRGVSGGQIKGSNNQELSFPIYYHGPPLSTSTKSEETLVLTGPSRGLLVFDNLFFEFDLKVRCNEDDMDFSKGKVQYCNHNTIRSKLIVNELKTKVSTIEIAYAAVKRAVEATIQINVPKEISLEFGKISALTTGIEKEVILFDSDASGTINIKDDGIQLCRSVVSVPIDGSLLLRVHIWEGDYKDKLSGSATVFTPHLCGEYVATLDHAMQVKVTWSPVYVAELDHKLVFDF